MVSTLTLITVPLTPNFDGQHYGVYDFPIFKGFNSCLTVVRINI